MKLLILLLFVSQTFAVWPAPQSFKSGNSTLWIDHSFSVSYNGKDCATPFHAIPGLESPSYIWRQVEQILRPRILAPESRVGISSKAIVQEAVKRAIYTIFDAKFVPWKLHARNQLSSFEPISNSDKVYIESLIINQTGTDTSSTFKPLAGEVDESYELNIRADGVAILTAASSTGVLHGLETFTQLFYLHSNPEAGVYSPFAPIHIIDSPKFSHRGLNMDVSRNWFPKSDILRTIDALSWNKFNRLHLHITDSQSWPMEIPALPLLSEKGSFQRGLSYSPQDIEDIQIYAIYRGVEVILEFDMPGHTTAIGLAYPELVAAFGAKPWETYCAEPPCGTLKLNSSAVSSFLNALFDDVLPRVLPYSSYFHTGGDEVNRQAYLLDETVKSDLYSVITPYLQTFIDRNHKQIRDAGLSPIVWEEMALEWALNLGSDVVVQTWINEASVAAVTTLGYKVIVGNHNFWYLDCGQGSWLDSENGPSFQKHYPFLDYCQPTKSWRLVYSYDPLAGLNEEQKALVLGGEVHIWSEQTDPANLDNMIWPRASAAAEVLWSGRQDASGQNRSQIDASPRLAEMRERMVIRGVNAGPVQMLFCTQHDATECSNS